MASAGVMVLLKFSPLCCRLDLNPLLPARLRFCRSRVGACACAVQMSVARLGPDNKITTTHTRMCTPVPMLLAGCVRNRHGSGFFMQD